MTEYEKARAEFDAAFAIFNPIMVAFTDVKIPMDQRPTWDEFRKAQEMQKEAVDKFDAAYATVAA